VRLPDAAGRVLALIALLSGAAPAIAQQQTDSLVPRVQQLVNLGNRTGARALADSALVIRTAGTQAYAEALYARALATADAASAERDYLRVGVEYPLSARAEAALMMAGQLKMSRGDRRGARALFERLALEFPQGTQAARAGYWAGRLALEDGDVEQGCRSLASASERITAEDVEFRNQVEYLRARCLLPAGSSAASSDSSAAREPPTSTQEIGATAQTEYSVQVAAYTRKRDADATLSRLRSRGFPVRVVGTRAPYRVRVGRYATREDAEAAQGRMRRAGVTGIVVEAEPDES
jgi:cell division septation protein DedD